MMQRGVEPKNAAAPVRRGRLARAWTALTYWPWIAEAHGWRRLQRLALLLLALLIAAFTAIGIAYGLVNQPPPSSSGGMLPAPAIARTVARDHRSPARS